MKIRIFLTAALATIALFLAACGDLPTAPGQIAFAVNSDVNYDDIYVMDADGGNVWQLTDDLAVNWMPTWSPDGTRIAFTSDRDGDGMDIYIMDADGGNVRRLWRLRKLVRDGSGQCAQGPVALVVGEFDRFHAAA